MATGEKETKKRKGEEATIEERKQPALKKLQQRKTTNRVNEGKKPFYVVGIGASAGGIEAFGDMVEHLPQRSGMAFILVQHLDPTHESMLAEILQRKTVMPVEEAKEGLPVQPDRIYVITPNRFMAIRNGKLKLVPRESGKFMPIDHLLTSLAEDRKNLAIGVILSGTGNDGTQGLRAIKAEGGSPSPSRKNRRITRRCRRMQSHPGWSISCSRRNRSSGN